LLARRRCRRRRVALLEIGCSFRVPSPPQYRPYGFCEPTSPLAISSAVWVFRGGVRRLRLGSATSPLCEFRFSSKAFGPTPVRRPPKRLVQAPSALALNPVPRTYARRANDGRRIRSLPAEAGSSALNLRWGKRLRLTTIPSPPAAASKRLSWAFAPFSTYKAQRSVVSHGACQVTRAVPPSGFGYPLGGLLPLCPGRPCFVPAALVGFALRSFLLSEGHPRVSARSSPHTVWPDGAPAARGGGPAHAGPRFPGFAPSESP